MKKAYKHIILSTTAAILLIACGKSNSADKNQTILIDKPQQVSDKPNAVSTKLAKAQLGVLSGATVKIEELGVVPYKTIAEEVTSAGDSIESIGNFDAHSESYDKDKFYLISVSGGLDMDVNDDGKIDPFPKLNKGTFHAIVKGENAKEVNGAFKVTTASEIVYKKVKADIDNTSTLEEKLDESAKEIFQKGTDDDKEVTNSDILNYDPIKDKENFHEYYQDMIMSIIKDIHDDKKDIQEDKKNEIIKTPPIAKAGGDISIVEGKEVILSARGLDSDGNIISYEWSEYGKTISDNREFKYITDTLGLHTLTLTVVDNDNLTSTDRVNITVLQKPNNYPIADKQTITIDEDSQKKITLTAKDSDNDSLTYKIIQEPINGMLSGKAPNFIYKPDINFNGEDSIIFVANDGKADSKKETITIYIKPSNDKPVILFDGDSITTEEDTSKVFTLKAKDQENDKLTYTITQKPKSGTLTHKNDNFNYTPNFNFNGSDSFIVTVKDGNGGEDSKKINVTITPVNDEPTVDIGDSKSILAGESITLHADAKDIDGKIVKYEWSENKKLLSNKASFTYKQEDIGNHTITLTITDNKGATATQRVVVHVSEVPNEKPKSENLSIHMKEDTSTNITLKSSDEDEDRLTYKIVQSPFHGTLRGKAPNISYSPIKDYFGKDSFTYRANDGKDDSNIAKVSITIDDVIEADTTAPVIDLHGSATISVTPKTKFVIPTPTAKDARDGVVKVITTGKVDYEKMGTYKLTYTATDKAGNKATKTRTIKVLAPLEPKDTIAPVITLKGSSTITVMRFKHYKEPGATAKDNIDGTVKVTIYGYINIGAIGTYTKHYTAVDKAGNKATKTRTIIVKEPAPEVTLRGASTVTLFQHQNYREEGATAKDSQGTVKVTINGHVDISKIGTYKLTYIATNQIGKTSKTRVIKIIKDSVAPVITLQGESTYTILRGERYIKKWATASDNASSYVPVTETGDVDTNKVGTYKIIYTAVDKSGNKATKTRTIKVVLPKYHVETVIKGNKLTVKWSGFSDIYHTISVNRPTKGKGYSIKGTNGEKTYTLDQADYEVYHYTLSVKDKNDLIYEKKFDVNPSKIKHFVPKEEPKILGNVNIKDGTHSDIILSKNGKTAFVFSSPELYVVDISNPTTPKIVKQLNIKSVVASGHSVISADGKKLYIAANEYLGAKAWVKIFDISNPNKIKEIKSIAMDGDIFSNSTKSQYYNTKISDVLGIALAPNQKTIAVGGRSGVVFIDISNINKPILKSSLVLPSLATNMTFSKNGKQLYIADFTSLQIIDTTNITHTRKIGEYITGDSSIAGYITLSPDNKKLYLTGQNLGLMIFNIQNPSKPKLIKKINKHYPDGESIQFGYSRKIELSADGKKAYLAGGGGLAIMDLTKLTFIKKIKIGNESIFSKDGTKAYTIVWQKWNYEGFNIVDMSK